MENCTVDKDSKEIKCCNSRCNEISPIINNVTVLVQSSKSPGGCIKIFTCPHCKQKCCIERSKPEPKLEPKKQKNKKTKNSP